MAKYKNLTELFLNGNNNDFVRVSKHQYELDLPSLVNVVDDGGMIDRKILFNFLNHFDKYTDNLYLWLLDNFEFSEEQASELAALDISELTDLIIKVYNKK